MLDALKAGYLIALVLCYTVSSEQDVESVREENGLVIQGRWKARELSCHIIRQVTNLDRVIQLEQP